MQFRNLSRQLSIAFLASFIFCFSCQTEQEIKPTSYPDVLIEMNPQKAASLAKQIRKEVAVKLAEDFELSLWAIDSLVSDPVAISVDPQGGIYYTHAERITNSEFDIRGYEDWMTTSQSFESVEDRRKFLREVYDPSRSDENESLEDLNKDGSHDWHDLTVEKEKIWRLEDSDGDGIADRSRLYIEDFHEEITDLANGVEFFEDEVFIAVGPDLWRTKDTDNDGIANETKSISHGYAVHIGFGAHGMSGVTVGPDGRLWWGIGDIGMNVVDQTGKRWKYPNQGVIVRSELDGSNFEVFSAGHRNTHEFAFDKYGNLISEDNDGDHAKERERLVYVVQGSDSGWRSSWQYGKYTDPDNNRYNVWMDEGLSIPRWEGQAAYILPPIVNYVNGPTGFVYNPGTALSSKWADHFFVAEFRGTPAQSPIHAFKLKPNGATFELESTQEIVHGTLPTGLDFGPDGALYFGDWIDGWGAKDRGRMWKLDIPGEANSAIRQEVKKLIQSDFSTKETTELVALLGHADMRIRQKAQFQIVKTENGFETLKQVVKNETNQMARIHALWGMGQLARKDNSLGSNFREFLNDGDPEIIAQASKLIGDVRFKGAGGQLMELLKSTFPRVQFFAAQALGRTAHKPAVRGILAMLEGNNDRDAWLRHAGTYALSQIGDAEPLVQLAKSGSKPARIAAIIALRRMKHEGLKDFLQDKDEYIVAEAARAIHDDLSVPAALPALADLTNRAGLMNQVVLRRAISANLRLGENAHLQNLVSYTLKKDAPKEMRAEALAALATWAKPSMTDRVDGRYRGEVKRESKPVVDALEPIIEKLLADKDPEVQIAAGKLVSKFKLSKTNNTLMALLGDSKSAGVRGQMLKVLSAIESPNMDKALELGLADKDSDVRSVALELVPQSNVADGTAAELLKSIMSVGTLQEKQSALLSLGQMKSPMTSALLLKVFEDFSAGKLEPELHLDVLDAMKSNGAETHLAKLTSYETEINKQGEFAAFNVVLNGGKVANGRSLFYNHKAAQCVRCHAIWEYGGDAGPSLTGLGSRMSKEDILESLLNPSAKIASGYGVVALEMNDGETVAGFYMGEDDNVIRIKEGKSEIKEIPKSDFKKRTDVPSSMPAVGSILTKGELRDLVAFLSDIKLEG